MMNHYQNEKADPNCFEPVALDRAITDDEIEEMAAPPVRRVFLCDDVPPGYTGQLEGRVNHDSGFHYLWQKSKPLPGLQRAWMAGSRDEALRKLEEHDLCGWWEDGQPKFAEKIGQEIVYPETERYAEDLLFSRNGTLVAREALAKKTVVIVGVGSVGSQVAALLARAGVMNFLLVDSDRVEIHNLSRAFDISSLGMYKTHAVRKTLLSINPNIQVKTLEIMVQQAGVDFYEQLIAGETLVIGAADNRVSDAWLNNLCETKQVDFMSCGFWDNAAVSETFVYRANTNDHIAGCLLEDSIVEDARIQHQNNYTSNDGVERKVNCGLGVNVQMGNAISSQLALDLLLRNTDGYIGQILPNLSSQMLFFVNTTNPALAGEKVARWFPRPLWSQCCDLHPSQNCRCAARGRAGIYTAVRRKMEQQIYENEKGGRSS